MEWYVLLTSSSAKASRALQPVTARQRVPLGGWSASPLAGGLKLPCLQAPAMAPLLPCLPAFNVMPWRSQAGCLQTHKPAPCLCATNPSRCKHALPALTPGYALAGGWSPSPSAHTPVPPQAASQACIGGTHLQEGQHGKRRRGGAGGSQGAGSTGGAPRCACGWAASCSAAHGGGGCVCHTARTSSTPNLTAKLNLTRIRPRPCGGPSAAVCAGRMRPLPPTPQTPTRHIVDTYTRSQLHNTTPQPARFSHAWQVGRTRQPCIPALMRAGAAIGTLQLPGQPTRPPPLWPTPCAGGRHSPMSCACRSGMSSGSTMSTSAM